MVEKLKHLLSLRDLTPDEILKIIAKGIEIKKNPKKYSQLMDKKSLLMIFAKPSLRTRLSFEVAMTQMSGHAIYYDIKDSPMGKKESIADTSRTASRYVDIIMARLFEHRDIEELAAFSSVPVINALTNFEHPCQVLGDLMTIKEKIGKLKGLKLAYVGDSNNNVTHSLLYGCSMVGMDISIACPKNKEFEPDEKIVKNSREFASRNKSKVEILNDPNEAVKNAEIIYTDSWMSYHIDEEEKEKRIKILRPYQINKELMKEANKNAYFMHCLPALRGYEVTTDVIDGKQSIVFEQAENRLHVQKAIMLKLLNLD